MAVKTACLRTFDIPVFTLHTTSPSDLLACVQVSRQWNKYFIPWLWYTIEGKDEDWIRRLFVKYGQHIRVFRLHWIILRATATGLSMCSSKSPAPQTLILGDEIEVFIDDPQMSTTGLLDARTPTIAEDHTPDTLARTLFGIGTRLVGSTGEPGDHWFRRGGSSYWQIGTRVDGESSN
ncbi:MAG: hypothetical protein J3Q66DRAFT_401342 [Benniella sp.]|nr:MAG: hypothetical protein J3Q66DRAFT_401342 [Benniella sp.]